MTSLFRILVERTGENSIRNKTTDGEVALQSFPVVHPFSLLSAANKQIFNEKGGLLIAHLKLLSSWKRGWDLCTKSCLFAFIEDAISMFSRLIQENIQETNSDGYGQMGGGDPCLVLTSDQKPRLRWTADLHERFVDAVAQLGGATSQYFSLDLCFFHTWFLIH